MDLEQGEYANKTFDQPTSLLSSKSVRIGFIRKVYLILSVQLLVTCLFCILSLTSDSFKTFQLNNQWMIVLAVIAYLVTAITLLCYRSLSRKVPTNYILLGVFTISLSYMTSCICSAVGDPNIVLSAAILTLGVTLALTAYAFTTKSDFTMMGAFLFVIMVTIFLTGILMWILSSSSNIINVFYCGLCVIFYGIYLIYDTQLIVGGKRHELEIDDYILASIILYVDIIYIFIRILEIISILKKQ